MANIQNLEKLVAMCGAPTLNDDAAFQELIEFAQDVLVINDDQCAELLDVSRPSVNRWRNGATSPRRVVRRHIYQVLLERAVGALKDKRNRITAAGGNPGRGNEPMVARSK